RYIQGYDRTQPDTLVDPHKASLEIPDFLKPGRGSRSGGEQKAEGKTRKKKKGGSDKDSKNRS
ncbi:amino acid ABC transporter permease, partial [Bifidobacterium sp. W8109]|nr:amino acid ABC transporter permease [Bifidobacterium asteroides]MBI0073991.1 amino acid ABC transporter permease [Bifidobacterium sp. W8110]